MQIIIVDDIGRQRLLNLPDGSEVRGIEGTDNSTKNERILRMLKAQGKEPKEEDLPNYIEGNFFYLTISGEEYIKLDLDEFWKFLEVCNALSMIDANEMAFYSINVYYSKVIDSENTLGRTSKETNLDSFIIRDSVSGETFSSSIGDLCSCLARGIIKNSNDILQHI